MDKKKVEKTFSGTVVSDKMTDTLVVLVESYVKHPKYGKYTKRRKKYKVHAPGSNIKIGDRVKFEASRPVSKTKRFKLVS